MITASLCEELAKITYDKLLLGIVLAFFAFYLSKILEKFKSGLAFSTELNKQRIQKVSDCWQALYQFEGHMDDVIFHYKEMRAIPTGTGEQTKYIKDNNLEKKCADGTELYSSLIDTLNKNRFWVEDAVITDIYSFGQLINEAVKAFVDGDLDKSSELEKKMEEKRKRVSDYHTLKSS